MRSRDRDVDRTSKPFFGFSHRTSGPLGKNSFLPGSHDFADDFPQPPQNAISSTATGRYKLEILLPTAKKTMDYENGCLRNAEVVRSLLCSIQRVGTRGRALPPARSKQIFFSWCVVTHMSLKKDFLRPGPEFRCYREGVWSPVHHGG